MAIYKYLAPARTQVLENATLRATQGNALNDPFELKPFFSTILEKADLEQKVREKSFFDQELKDAYMKQPAALRAKIPWNKFRVLSKQHGFKQQIEVLMGREIDKIVGYLPNLVEEVRNLMYEKLGNMVGIVSFSEVPNESLMWAHYANDHKGFVVEFDDSDSFFDQRRNDKDEFFHLRSVEYHEKPLSHVKLTDLDGTKVLCAKQSRWSYERERRMLIPVDHKNFLGAGEPIHLISFPRSAVRAVIFGQRASDSLIAMIKRILASSTDYQHVKLRNARADLNSGNIVIDDLDQR